MKVGIVCPYSFDSPGGVQNHVLGLAGWLANNGHEVSVIGPGRPDGPSLALLHDADVEFTTTGSAVSVSLNHSVAQLTFGRRARRIMRAWLAAGDFDVVHVHEPMAPVLSLWALKFATCPTVATLHAYTPREWAIRVLKGLVRAKVERIDEGIAVSSSAAEVAEQYLADPPTVIGNGIEFADFPTPRTTIAAWRGGERPLIVFIGRFDEPRKGLDVFIDALERVRQSFGDVDAVVIGQGESPRVPGIRYVIDADDDERNAWLAKADIYLAPHTGRESFGIVLLEALACGAPVVASDLPAFVEVLSDGQGVVGRTFSTGDAQACAEAMLASLAEPRNLRLVRGLARAAQFDWSVIGPQVVARYAAARGPVGASAR